MTNEQQALSAAIDLVDAFGRRQEQGRILIAGLSRRFIEQ
jgi:hypothetical protein